MTYTTEQLEAMRPDRRFAIEAMQDMGWNVRRTKPGKNVVWEFRRPDTGGLWDLVKCRQDQLSARFVTDIALRYGDADELSQRIEVARSAWFARRFTALTPKGGDV